MSPDEAATQVVKSLFNNLAEYRDALGDVDAQPVAAPLRRALGYQHDRLLHALVALTRNPDVRDRTDLDHDLLKVPRGKYSPTKRWVAVAKEYGIDRGQLLKHPEHDDAWRVRVFLGRLTGRKQYASRTVTGTADDAIRVLRDMLAEADEGTLTPADKATKFGVFIRTRWLPSKRDDVEARTLRGYADAAEAWVIPTLGSYTVSGVTSQAIRRLLLGLESGRLAKKGEPLSTTSRGLAYTVVRQALDLAVRDGLVRHNVAASVERPSRG